MGKGSSPFYTEYVMVKEFGTGIYDLPWESVSRLMQVMEVEGKVMKQKQAQSAQSNQSNNGFQTRPHHSGKRRRKQSRR